MGQIWPTVLFCFFNKVLLGHICPFTCIVYGCFCTMMCRVWWERVYTAKSKLFTLWPFTENICWSLENSIQLLPGHNLGRFCQAPRKRWKPSYLLNFFPFVCWEVTLVFFFSPHPPAMSSQRLGPYGFPECLFISLSLAGHYVSKSLPNLITAPTTSSPPKTYGKLSSAPSWVDVRCGELQIV